MAEAPFAPGDEVVLSHLEHHANIVPWQLLQEERGIVLRVIPIDDRGVLRLEALPELISPRTKLVAITHVSNAIGTINPVAEIIALAHADGAVVLVDGCQAVQHMRVDVRAIDADFYVFSGHKLYGPTGIGVLYGKKRLLDRMPPYQGGGEMILTVSFEKTTFKQAPHRFEAGTPAIVEAIGLGAAVDFLSALDIERVAAHERELLAYATAQVADIPGIRIYGTAPDKAPILSFTLDGRASARYRHHPRSRRRRRPCRAPLRPAADAAVPSGGDGAGLVRSLQYDAPTLMP